MKGHKKSKKHKFTKAIKENLEFMKINTIKQHIIRIIKKLCFYAVTLYLCFRTTFIISPSVMNTSISVVLPIVIEHPERISNEITYQNNKYIIFISKITLSDVYSN